jgi:hypothetical protein
MQNVCHEVRQAQQKVCSHPERVSLDRCFRVARRTVNHAPESVGRITKLPAFCEVASLSRRLPGPRILLISNRVGMIGSMATAICQHPAYCRSISCLCHVSLTRGARPSRRLVGGSMLLSRVARRASDSPQSQCNCVVIACHSSRRRCVGAPKIGIQPGASRHCHQRGDWAVERRSPTRRFWFGLVQRRRAGGRRSGGSVKMRPIQPAAGISR